MKKLPFVKGVLSCILVLSSMLATSGVAMAKTSKKTSHHHPSNNSVVRTSKSKHHSPVTHSPRKVSTRQATGAIVAVSSTAVTSPVAACMRAIMKANVECQAIARGCPSWSKTPECVAKNQACEEKQRAALALCPSIN